MEGSQSSQSSSEESWGDGRTEARAVRLALLDVPDVRLALLDVPDVRLALLGIPDVRLALLDIPDVRLALLDIPDALVVKALPDADITSVSRQVPAEVHSEDLKERQAGQEVY